MYSINFYEQYNTTFFLFVADLFLCLQIANFVNFCSMQGG